MSGNVFLTVGYTPGVKSYHTDPNCRYLDGREVEEIPCDLAELRNKPPCKYCVLDSVEWPDSLDRTCPLCGDSITTLPNHLPCDPPAHTGGERA